MEISKDENRDNVEGSEQWSLKYVMASCQDFAEELTALQHVGQDLGVTVHITPKFHAEMAGKGIEYSWAVCKSVYRKMPLDSKRGKELFKALVNECISRDILKTEVARKLSKRARAYICTYYILHQ
jgi:predicted transcriptional regulator